MEIIQAPSQLVLPWGNGDSTKTNPVPVPSQIGITPGAASWTDGFPPLCATAVTSGGVPPAKADMNGGLFQMSAVDVWMCAGAGFLQNSSFATAIGGYPIGARVLRADYLGYWQSIVDNNTSNPDAGGAGWVSDGGWSLQSGTIASPLPLSSGITIPANTLQLGSVLRLTAIASTGAGSSSTAGINVGSSALLPPVTFGPSAGFLVDVVMVCNGIGTSGGLESTVTYSIVSGTLVSLKSNITPLDTTSPIVIAGNVTNIAFWGPGRLTVVV